MEDAAMTSITPRQARRWMSCSRPRPELRTAGHRMKFQVLVLDYDGTVASKGRLDPDVRSAIAELRAAGVNAILATGRMLDELEQVAGDLRTFDAVVAENGAVVAFP